MLIECSEYTQPKLFIGSAAFVAMADCKLWTFGPDAELIIERELFCPFEAMETSIGILVFYELGCCLLSLDGRNKLWDFSYNVVIDYELRDDVVYLMFDDGSKKYLSAKSGELIEQIACR